MKLGICSDFFIFRSGKTRYGRQEKGPWKNFKEVLEGHRRPHAHPRRSRGDRVDYSWVEKEEVGEKSAIFLFLRKFPNWELFFLTFNGNSFKLIYAGANGLFMLLVGIERLHHFMQGHADARKWLENWIAEARVAKWEKPLDIKKHYQSASILGGNRVIFDVKGSDYRMEVQIAYKNGTVLVRWIGTHAEYTKRFK